MLRSKLDAGVCMFSTRSTVRKWILMRGSTSLALLSNITFPPLNHRAESGVMFSTLLCDPQLFFRARAEPTTVGVRGGFWRRRLNGCLIIASLHLDLSEQMCRVVAVSQQSVRNSEVEQFSLLLERKTCMCILYMFNGADD